VLTRAYPRRRIPGTVTSAVRIEGEYGCKFLDQGLKFMERICVIEFSEHHDLAGFVHYGQSSIENGSSIQSSTSMYLEGGGNDNITVSGLSSNSITLAQFMSGSDATINGLNPSDFTLKYSDTTISSGNELLVTASPNSGGNATTTICRVTQRRTSPAAS
jgi:hypothetical protein